MKQWFKGEVTEDISIWMILAVLQLWAKWGQKVKGQGHD